MNLTDKPVCQKRGCRTQLNRWNAQRGEDRCYLHQPKDLTWQARALPEEGRAAQKVCPDCGVLHYGVSKCCEACRRSRAIQNRKVSA